MFTKPIDMTPLKNFAGVSGAKGAAGVPGK